MRYAYFPISGVASVVVEHFEGSASEVALIGREGVTGALSLLGSSIPTAECFMQVAGSGWQMPSLVVVNERKAISATVGNILWR